jgi:hypothetical protein
VAQLGCRSVFASSAVFFLRPPISYDAGMDEILPTDEQRRALCGILHAAFVELRTACDQPQQVYDLAYALQNLPLEMYGWGTWEPDKLRDRLRRYCEKHPSGSDYVAMLDAIIPPGDA